MTENESEFRWRSKEIMRIEGLSDAVFAFAVTLLVVSLEVPRTYDDLIDTILGFPAFGVCFALLLLIWYGQHTFFRRYGLQDGLTVTLNCALLFLVLFYVYPLKFLWTFIFDQMLGLRRNQEAAITSVAQMQSLMVIYALGYIAVFVVFILLHLHAWRRRGLLSLTESEMFETRTSIQRYVVFVGVGVLSLGIALVGGDRSLAVAGYAYVLIGPAASFHGYRRRKTREAMLARAASPSPD